MARYGTWKPLAPNWANQSAITGPDLIILHTMVGSLAGTDSYFRRDGYGGTESHFGVGHDGAVWQWQDTNRRAEANLGANDNAVSVETADTGTGFPAWSGSDVPAWTPKQVDALVNLVAWACRTHDIPCVLIPDSRPGRRGIGYHRQGVDPYRVDGGEVWSTAYGKVCPGNRRVAQIPGIIARARVIVGADPVPGPDPTDPGPTPTPTPTRRRDNMVKDIYLTGTGSRRIPLPVGQASAITEKAWVSIVGEGPEEASAHVWFQRATAGISDVWLVAPFANGISGRPVREFPDGTEQINVQYHFPNGGTISIETLARA